MPDETAMRDELVGYLLDALDEGEARRVEAALADPDRGPALRDDLDTLRQAIRPLTFDRDAIDVPAGLAARTLQFVAAQTAAAPEHRRPKPTPRGFAPDVDEARGPAGRRWLDRLIVGATAVAACVLVAPLLLDSIEESRQRRVDRNLQRVSTALQGYAESHGMYPTPPAPGRFPAPACTPRRSWPMNGSWRMTACCSFPIRRSRGKGATFGFPRWPSWKPRWGRPGLTSS